MNCRHSENDIALYVEGDLEPAKACEIQAHLATCRSCGDLAASLRESQLILKSLRQDMVGTSALSAVRARVLAEIGPRAARRGWGRWVFGIAGATFLAVMTVGIAFQIRQPAQVRQVVEVHPLPPAAAVTTPAPVVTDLPQNPRAATDVTDRLYSRGSAPVSAVICNASRCDAYDRAQTRTPTPAEPPKPLVVKLLTDDPNVVIYWLVDQKNGGTL